MLLNLVRFAHSFAFLRSQTEANLFKPPAPASSAAATPAAETAAAAAADAATAAASTTKSAEDDAKALEKAVRNSPNALILNVYVAPQRLKYLRKQHPCFRDFLLRNGEKPDVVKAMLNSKVRNNRLGLRWNRYRAVIGTQTGSVHDVRAQVAGAQVRQGARGLQEPRLRLEQPGVSECYNCCICVNVLASSLCSTAYFLFAWGQSARRG